jgi:hypothetical protein
MWPNLRRVGEDLVVGPGRRRAHANFRLGNVHSAGPEPFGESVTGRCDALDLEFRELRAVLRTWRLSPASARSCSKPSG